MTNSTPQPLNNSTQKSMPNSTPQHFNNSTSNDVLIKVEHVSKKYCRFLKESMIYGMSDVGRNVLRMGSHSERLRKNEFWAVDDVSFEVKRGETLGLIGANGSGKTTLLKMLNGIFWPDKGKITIRGRIGALISVGAGFHPLLTGRENIYVNGAILGMTKREVDKKFDAIVDFAEIGDFLDSPVKHYSSGMYVRLGFAVAVHSRCDILLIDEVLAVGDMKFQAKCIEKIKEKGEQGVTKIFVSHNLNSVQMLCKNTIYLSKGEIHRYGDTGQVLDEFRKNVSEGHTDDVSAVRFGTRDVEITKVEFLDRSQCVKQNFCRGERLQVSVSFVAKKPVRNPIFSVSFVTEDGLTVLKRQTRKQGFQIRQIHNEGTIILTIEALSLPVGKYLLTVRCWDSDLYLPYDCHEEIYPLIVEEGVNIPQEWEIFNGRP